MLRQLTYRQFLEWKLFDAINPIGDKRGDWRAAAISATVMNAAERITATLARRQRVSRTWRPEQLLLKFVSAGTRGKKDDGQHWKEQKALAKIWHAIIERGPEG
jgi:hypothetical protein